MAEHQETLVRRMVRWADDHELAADDPMRRLARNLELAVANVDGGEAQLKKFLGAWSRARHHWADVTGDELV